MKVKTIALLTILCLLFTTAACSTKSPAESNQAEAYMAVLHSIYKDDTALNRGQYMAADLTKIQLADKEPLRALLEAFCNQWGYILMEDTFDGLSEKGYIKDLYFEDGFLISFEDKSLTDTKLRTKAQKWVGGLGAIGADYTVTLKNGVWEIKKIENQYIS